MVRKLFSIRSWRPQIFVDIHCMHDGCLDSDLVALQAIGIPTTIVVFMMLRRYDSRKLENWVARVTQEFLAAVRMRFSNFKLFRG